VLTARGSFVVLWFLVVWDFAFVTNIGIVSGDLLATLADHHDKNRKWEEENKSAPQHAEFTVSAEGGYLGELGPVSSMVSEVRFVVRDREICQQFYAEIRGFQRIRGYRP